jgi:hypothetical protein
VAPALRSIACEMTADGCKFTAEGREITADEREFNAVGVFLWRRYENGKYRTSEFRGGPSQLPGAVISTADHPLGSPSQWYVGEYSGIKMNSATMAVGDWFLPAVQRGD